MQHVRLETKEATPAEFPVEIKASIEKYLSVSQEALTKNETRLANVEKKFDDVVTREEQKKLDDALTEFKKEINEAIVELKRAPKGGSEGDAEFEQKADQVYAAEMKALDVYVRGDRQEGMRLFGEAKALATTLEVKDLSTVLPEDGGYMVRPEHEAEMIEVVEEISDIRRIARVMESGTGEKKIPVDMGGAQAAWTTELAARTKTAHANIKERTFVASELYAFNFLSESLKEDAEFDVVEWLMSNATEAIARAEGAAFVNGDGHKKPRGFLNQSIVANASWAWGSIGYIATGAAGDFAPAVPGSQLGPSASTNGADVLFDLVHSLPRLYRANCDWVMNRLTLAKVRKLKDADGNYLFKDQLTQSGFLSMLLGYPITEAEDMPDVAADSYSIAFGDFNRGYYIIDRTGITVKRDDTSEPQFDKVYFRRRVGGDVADYQAIKLLKFSAS